MSKSNENKAQTTLVSNKVINGFSNFSNNTSSKKYWGEPTWYLFHSIAARINSDFYCENYKEIWEFIKLCCSMLPCPYCRNHAVFYTNQIKLNDVNKKEKLIQVLFNFHNSVNSRIGKKLYLEKDLEKYNKANINKIFTLFESRFFRSYYNTREFQDMHKLKFKESFHDFKNLTGQHYN